MTARSSADSSRQAQHVLPATLTGWALFLDVDGTLLEIAPSPDAVVVSPTLPLLLGKLQQQLNGALALISGRPLAELDQLFQPLQCAGAGLHGAEWRSSPGPSQLLPVDLAALEDARQRAHELVRALPGVLIEDKGRTIALHWRKAPAHEAALRAGAERIAGATGLVIQPGKCVFELKPAGINKGDALRRLSAQPPFAGRRPLFIGDDLTDAFAIEAAQRLGGAGIAVGPTLAAIADGELADPAAVLKQLQCWSEQ